jgi:hypothetical protein
MGTSRFLSKIAVATLVAARCLSTAPALSAEKSLSVIDFLLDFDGLQGLPTSVSGIGLMFGNRLIIYSDRNSAQFAVVSVDRATRDERKSAMENCGFCTVTVAGHAATIDGLPGIVADRITVGRSQVF